MMSYSLIRKLSPSDRTSAGAVSALGSMMTASIWATAIPANSSITSPAAPTPLRTN